MKFFVGNIPFEILPMPERHAAPSGGYTLMETSPLQIFRYYQIVCSGNVRGQASFRFYARQYDQTIHSLKSYFEMNEAAGGIVKKDEKLLFIFRKNVWDLPKGKIDPGETPSVTAVREVEEETGVEASITRLAGTTWHAFRLFDRDILKLTHWYAMDCLNDQRMAPQAEEMIEKVAWLKKEEITERVFPCTYASVKEILHEYGFSPD